MTKFKELYKSAFTDSLISLLHDSELLSDNDSSDLLIALYFAGKDNNVNQFYDTVSDIVNDDSSEGIQVYIAGYIFKRFKSRWLTVNKSILSNISLFTTSIVNDSLNQKTDHDTKTNFDFYPVDSVADSSPAQDKENKINSDGTLDQTRITEKTSMHNYSQQLDNYLKYSSNFLIDLICKDILEYLTVTVY